MHEHDEELLCFCDEGAIMFCTAISLFYSSLPFVSMTR